MVTVADQKKWEREMIALGVSRFRRSEEKAKLGQRYTDTSAATRLIKVYVSQVGDGIREYIENPRNRSKYIKLLKGIDCDKLAMFTLHRIVECLYKPATVQRVAASLGKMVEDELRFSKFELEKPEFYNTLIRDLDSRNSIQYKHRHRVLISKMNGIDISWNEWSNEIHIGVGLLLLQCAEANSDLVEKRIRKRAIVIEPTDEVVEWIKEHDESIELMFPDRMPCIHQPDNWTDWQSGGFYTSRLRSLTPLVKTRAGQQRDTQSVLLDTACMPDVLDSVNAMQDTSWAINTKVLEVLREVWDRGLGLGMPSSHPYEIPKAPIPEGKKPAELVGPAKIAFDEWKAEAHTLYTMENERKASLMSIVRAMRMASRLDHLDLLWMVYQLDFRSRTYTTTSGVSPQGSDVSKALLHFGVAEYFGKNGWFWFQVHGANKYGEDKGSYQDRVDWVQRNHGYFISVGKDPIGNASYWKDADKPYQFLAWCMEYYEAHRVGIDNFKSRLPIALDGSCNGLQHFSAMLRDEVGASSVNLSPNEVPADIYQDVADVTNAALREIITDPSHEFYTVAANWCAFFDKHYEGKISRKLSKKPVMTLPYGSTLQTCTQSVYSWYIEQDIDFFPKNTAFKHSIFLSSVLWKSIGKVVKAAREAMAWLQTSARLLAKEDQPIVYTTPVGFPMVQFTPKTEKKRVTAQIGGRLTLQILKEVPGVDRYKASYGSSPNLVHSVDAAHMHKVVARGVREGLDHFALIHDDFAVHARFIDTWHTIIREEFVSMYEQHDILAEFKKQNEERTGLTLPDLPSKGNFDIREVLKSPYFFG